jgi:malate dehydrogenase (oxaloacetate-decarboxylating)
MLGRIASAIGEAGGDIGAVDIVGVAKEHIIRDLSVDARDETHGEAIVAAVRAVDGVEVVSVSDRTFLLHLGGKIQIQNKAPLKTRDDLSMAYTPGVARVCRAIHADPSKVYQLTTKRNMVAVVTDGTAVLGLGDIGPEAALPVMEGKAMLFKEFANVDAFPICLATKDVDEIVATVRAIAPGFGGINLEDISAPRCFTIEERLRQELSIPVFHDDQHGTAVVVLAALLNALRIVGKSLSELRIAVVGAGAAGVATVKLLLAEGARQIRVCDRQGILAPDRGDLSGVKEWLAQQTNRDGEHGGIPKALEGADVFIGVSGPGIVTPEDVQRMAPDAIVFALANPDPEIRPEDVGARVRVMATGRSDYPNQINNVLAFPGIFRGALDCRAGEINEAMKVAAARAIAGAVPGSDLQEEYIVPSVFNKKVVELVAGAVIRAARETGVARRQRGGDTAAGPAEAV